jgi:hypothetical protein
MLTNTTTIFLLFIFNHNYTITLYFSICILYPLLSQEIQMTKHFFFLFGICLTILISTILCFGFVNAAPQTTNSAQQISGEIDYYAFSRSIPKHVTIGESCKVLVFVKNTGESPAHFLVVLTAPNEFIYPQRSTRVIALDSGESRRIEFLITPTKPHTGELNITAKLYLLEPSLIELDSASDSVFLIKRNFSTEDITAVCIIVMLLTLCAAALITIKKKK